MRRKSITITLDHDQTKTILKKTTPVATRYKASSSAHLAIVSGTLNSLGVDMDDVTASVSSSKRHRKEAQNERAEQIRETFREKMPSHIVVHWDGKITQFLGEQGYTYQDVNAVVVTSPLNIPQQFLGAPVMEAGATGRALADVTHALLVEWGIVDQARVIALVFDTTSSNSGLHEGAAKWLEEALGPVLYNACRHHIYELHIKHPYNAVMGPTKGPDDPLFKRFQKWFVEQKEADPAFPDSNLFRKWSWPSVYDETSPTGPYKSGKSWFARASLTWAQEQLRHGTFARGDYRELAELLNFILGGEPIRIRAGEVFQVFELRKPGAYHHARFMGKSLYILKIYLLSHVFELSRRDSKNLDGIAEYIILIYVRYFLSSRLSTAAPRLDLSFWYELKTYRGLLPVTLQRKIVDEASRSVRRHLWYLCPELAVLGLFDDELSEYEKEKMALQLTQTPCPAAFQTGKPGQPNFDPIAAHLTAERPSLSMFITDRSWLVFHLLDIQMPSLHWLTLPPSEWNRFPTYLHMRSFLQDMEVVNDAAERAVKAVGEYAHMTRAVGDRDNVILVACDHRGRIANLRKRNLNYV
jgi:hypothetical protein